MNYTMSMIESVANQGPFTPDWESLSQYQPPEWYRRAKFGIFIHWGVYAVPAFGNEWYPRNMYLPGTPEYEHHIKTYGPHKEFGYKDFIPMFTADKFDPEAWAELFEASGAKYVVPVAETSRWVPDVRQRSFPLERRGDGPQAQCDGRTV